MTLARRGSVAREASPTERVSAVQRDCDAESTNVEIVHNSQLDPSELQPFQREALQICEAELKTQAPSLVNSESPKGKKSKGKKSKPKDRFSGVPPHIARSILEIETRDRELYFQRLAAKEKLQVQAPPPETANVGVVYATSVWCEKEESVPVAEADSGVKVSRVADPRRLQELDLDKLEREERRARREVPANAVGVKFDDYEKYDNQQDQVPAEEDEVFSCDYSTDSQLGSQHSQSKPRDLISELRRTKLKNARAYVEAAVPVSALNDAAKEVDFDFNLSEDFGVQDAVRMLQMTYHCIAQNKTAASLFLAMFVFQAFSSIAYATLNLFAWVLQISIMIPMAKANFDPSRIFDKRNFSNSKQGKPKNLRSAKPKLPLWKQLLVGVRHLINSALGSEPDDRCANIAAAADYRKEFKVRKAYSAANRKLNSINHSYTQAQIFESDILCEFSQDVSERRPYVKCMINGVQEEYMLYDLGSSVNLCNESVVWELEKKLGYTLARIPSSIVLKTFAGNSIGQVGAVLLDIAIGDFVVTLPFLLVGSSTKTPIILGTQAILKHMIVLDFKGRDQCYLRFAGSNKSITKVELCDNVHPLYSKEDVTCPANSYVSVEVGFVAAGERKHNFARKHGLVTKHGECGLPLEIQEGVATVDAHGVVTVPLRNSSESDVILHKFSIISNFQRLDPNAFIDISDDLDFHGMSDAVVINHCPCFETNPLIVICDNQGEANLGERFVPKHLPASPEGKGMMHFEDGVMYLIPDRKRGFDAFVIEDFEESMLSAGLPLKVDKVNRAYSLIYSNASLLTKTFRDFFLKLNYEYKIQLRFSAAFDEIRSCQVCYESRLDFHYPIVHDANKVAEVTIFVPQNNVVPSDVYFAKNKDDTDSILKFQGIEFQLYKVGYQKVLVFCHLPPLGVPDLDYALTRLMIQLKDRFPNSVLQIRTSIVEGGLAAQDDALSTAVHSALSKVKQRKSRYVTSQRKAKKQNLAKLETVKVNPASKQCGCLFCHNAIKKASVSRVVYEGEFPRITYTKDEQQAYLEAKLAEYRISESEYKDDMAEIGAIIAHDLRLKGPHTISAEAAISEVTISACSVDFTYTRAGKIAYEDPNLHEASLDEITPIGYDSQRLLPRQRKFNTDRPLDFISTTNMAEDCKEQFELLVRDYHQTLLSFDSRDFSLIRNYSLKLRLSKEESFYCRPFPLKEHESRILNEQLAGLEMAGIICKAGSDTMFVCNAFLVKKDAASKMALDKKDVEYRLVCDFRPLNKLIQFTTDRFNIYGCASLVAKIGELRESDKGLFSVCDVKSFFASLPVEHSSRRFLGIRGHMTPVYTYLQSPLGLAHMPSIMGDLLERVLSPEIKRHCLFHLDDIVVVSSSCPVEHARLLRILWSDLLRLGVHLSASKLQLFRTKINYLGVEITQDQVNILPSRKKYIASLPFPANKQQLSTLLGIASFVQQHIDSYQILAAMLTPLIGLKTPFFLTEKHRACIRVILAEIEDAPSLFLIVKNCPLIVSCDASLSGAGCAVTQLVNNEVHLIRFYSFKFNRSNTLGLHSTMRELMAILVCCYKLDYLLTGHDDVIILTDLRSLAYVCAYSMSQKNSVLHRYMARLFALNISFKLGWLKNDENLIQIPDFMSRQSFEGEERFAYVCKYSHKFDDLNNPAFDEVRFPAEWYKNANISMDEFRTHIISMLQEPDNKSGEILRQATKRVQPKHAAIPKNFDSELEAFPRPKRGVKQAHYVEDFEEAGFDMTDGHFEEACAVYVAAVTVTEASENGHIMRALNQSLSASNDPCSGKRSETGSTGLSSNSESAFIAFAGVGNPSEQNSFLSDRDNMSMLMGSPSSAASAASARQAGEKGSLTSVTSSKSVTRQKREKELSGSQNLLSSFKRITVEEIRDEQFVHYPELMNMFQTLPEDKIPKRVRNSYVFLNNYVLAYYPARKRHDSKFSPKLLLSPRLALNALALFHCVSHVSGSRLLQAFNKQYYVKQRTHYATVISQCCKTCLLWKSPIVRDYVPGHLRRYSRPYMAYAIDFFFLGEKERVGRRATDTVLNIVDSFSHMSYAQIVHDNKTDTVIQALENFLATVPMPAAFILSDNEKSLNPSKKLQNWCLEREIVPLLSSSYVSTSNSLVEQSNMHLRRTIQRVMSTFGFKRWVDAFPTAKHILNSMERTYCGGTPEAFKSSAIHLNTGIEPRDMLLALSSEDRPIAKMLSLRDECQAKLNQHFRQQEEQLEKDDAKFEEKVKVNDLVLLRVTPENKNAPTYSGMVYRVVSRLKRTLQLQPVYGDGKTRSSHIKHIKKFYSHELLGMLTPAVQAMYRKINEFDPRHLSSFLKNEPRFETPITRRRAKKDNLKLLRPKEHPKGDADTNSSNGKINSNFSEASSLTTLHSPRGFNQHQQSKSNYGSLIPFNGDALIRDTGTLRPGLSKAPELISLKGMKGGESERVHSTHQCQEDLPISPTSRPALSASKQSKQALTANSVRNVQFSNSRKSNSKKFTVPVKPGTKYIDPNHPTLELSFGRTISFSPKLSSTPETALSRQDLSRLQKAPKKPFGPVVQRARKLVKRIFGSEGELSPASRITPPRPKLSRRERRRQRDDDAQRGVWEADSQVAENFRSVDTFRHQASPILRRSGRQRSVSTKLKDYVTNFRGKKVSKKLAAIPEER